MAKKRRNLKVKRSTPKAENLEGSRPIEIFYSIYFYDASSEDKEPVQQFQFHSLTVPYAFSKGDFVDPSGWGTQSLPPDDVYEVTNVEHQLTLPGSPPQGQHNIIISMKAVRKSEGEKFHGASRI